ncbi:hypothetical protein CVT24_010248 [Panaeolus cyanescens]|uniref:Uncharacterized protein n=1 Tax=Panaeolus cyanescens TaxID=181874 RepID=A0A409WME0_9AGAR|nr:hypothetical protein CVT24_010248 [Panaeolus cyanescens]
MGAKMNVRFFGTTIGVFGVVAPYNGVSNVALDVQFAIDGGSSTSFTSPSPDPSVVALNLTQYYQSHNLSPGEHVLTITNMVDKDIVMIDYYLIQSGYGGSPVPPPQILPFDRAATPPNTPSSPSQSTSQQSLPLSVTNSASSTSETLSHQSSSGSSSTTGQSVQKSDGV